MISLAAALVAMTMIDSRSTLAALAFGFGVWLIVGSLWSLADRLKQGTLRTTPRATLGMVIAHASLGIVVLGSVATSAWHTEVMQTMKPGDRISFAGYAVQLDKIEQVQGPNYVAERATLNVTVGGKPYAVLQPERRLFTVQRRQVAETAIQTNFLRDFYATLGEGDPSQGWVIRLYLNPSRRGSGWGRPLWRSVASSRCRIAACGSVRRAAARRAARPLNPPSNNAPRNLHPAIVDPGLDGRVLRLVADLGPRPCVDRFGHGRPAGT